VFVVGSLKKHRRRAANANLIARCMATLLRATIVFPFYPFSLYRAAAAAACF